MTVTFPCTYCGDLTTRESFFATHVPYCSLTHAERGQRRHWPRMDRDEVPCTNRSFCRHCQRCLRCAEGTACPKSPTSAHEAAPLLTDERVRTLRQAWQDAKQHGQKITAFAEPVAQHYMLSNYDIRALLHGDTWQHVTS